MKLPQCEILYTPAVPRAEILFVAGGRRPNSSWFKTVAQDRKVIGVDRGVEVCRDSGILPLKIIGDFDSAENSAVAWALDKEIPTERHPVDKDLTDTQLALNLIDENISAIVTGVFGGRFDHAFSTAFTCANVPAKIFLADDREIIFFVKGGETVEVHFNERPVALSLLPMTATCEGVTIKNVRWELEGAVLSQSFPNAVSNRAEAAPVKISARTGTLAVYVCCSEFFSRSISA